MSSSSSSSFSPSFFCFLFDGGGVNQAGYNSSMYDFNSSLKDIAIDSRFVYSSKYEEDWWLVCWLEEGVKMWILEKENKCFLIFSCEFEVGHCEYKMRYYKPELCH